VRGLPPPTALAGPASYEFFYAPRRTAGAIPTTDGLTCVFVGGPPTDLAPLVRAHGPDDALRHLLSQAFPVLADRLACGSVVEHVRYDRGRAGRLRQAWGSGWALVGDAGYWKDPLSTHGITDALRDAELLARAVLAAVRAGACDGPRLEQALAQYQATRDRLSLQMVDVVERIAGYSWDLPQIQKLLRELTSAMTDEVEALAALPQAA
jgi:2-polyprenyl-6-methoxyphenol hydroxylase-like FAD-dependent oxidoreductase